MAYADFRKYWVCQARSGVDVPTPIWVANRSVAQLWGWIRLGFVVNTSWSQTRQRADMDKCKWARQTCLLQWCSDDFGASVMAFPQLLLRETTQNDRSWILESFCGDPVAGDWFERWQWHGKVAVELIFGRALSLFFINSGTLLQWYLTFFLYLKIIGTDWLRRLVLR